MTESVVAFTKARLIANFAASSRAQLRDSGRNSSLAIGKHWTDSHAKTKADVKIHQLYLGGALLFLWLCKAQAAVYYVNANGANPAPPYANWTTAATNIQDALRAAGSVGGTILVTNGVYQFSGGYNNGSNRVNVLYGNFTVQSVNGPAVTVIQGYQVPGATNGNAAVRGVFLAAGSTLSGFTVTGGATLATGGSGGGIYCQYTTSVVTNCVISGNASSEYGGGVYDGTLINCIVGQNVSASSGGGCFGNGSELSLTDCLILTNSAITGGGVWGGNLTNCVLVGNVASSTGGGAYYPQSMDNCTLVGNIAGNSGGGGVYGGTVNNCVLYYNGVSSGIYASNYNNAVLNWCCTYPAPTTGGGNLTNAPGFVDLAGGNYRLQTGSPCVNAGTNACAPEPVDLDGNPRVVGAAVDLGAYENQNTHLIHYVSLGSANPVPPYTNWLTAAAAIQDAVSVAQPGDIVAANSGIYTNGGVVVFGAETNRVAVTNGVTLLAVYGRQATLIAGGTQMRCAYVGSNSLLSGFTITNGHSSLTGNVTNEQSGGGIWCEPGGWVANCLVISNFAGNNNNFQSSRLAGGIYGGTVSNCTLTGNFAGVGGGAGGGGTLWNCTLANNLASGGGGAYQIVLHNCSVSNNVALYNGFNSAGGGLRQCLAYDCLLVGNSDSNLSNGGGAFQGTNFNCTIVGNRANYGGGTYQSTNYNCFLSGNSAAYYGGGAYQGTLYNCLLTGNEATNSGAGACGSMLVNCTVVGNTAASTGGGVYGGTAYNSIIYLNNAAGGGSNWTSNPQMYYCCTFPMPVNDGGDLTNDPSFVDPPGGDYQLKCGSPCIDAGFTNAIIFGTTSDIRGVPRPPRPDLGTYEYNPATDEVPGIRAAFSSSSFSTGYAVPFVAQLGGCADYYWWDFGDGTTVTNQSNVSHAWAVAGTFNLRLLASYSGLVLSAATNVQVVPPPVYYVNQQNIHASAPYMSWGTAAVNLQQAVSAGNTPGRLVLVSNGNYGAFGSTVGGSMFNSVVLTNPVLMQSLNGPQVTTIFPYYASGERCCYVGSNAVLSGFTLGGGATYGASYSAKDQSGGGVWCESGGLVSNCIISGNTAYYQGGGAYQGAFYNCVFSGNSASDGGGAFASTLYNCLVTSNTAAAQGGGAYSGAFYNCTVAGNTAPTGGGIYGNFYTYNSIIYDNTADNWDGNTPGGSNNCIFPQFLPVASGNITNDPAFASVLGGDFHLQPDSPCINSGANAYAPTPTDLDGNPRLMGGTVDMGAYEFQAQVTGTFAAWLQQYGLPTDGSVDDADTDGTGMVNWQKWIAGLNPTNPASVLALSPLMATNNANGVTVTWDSVTTRTYYLQRSTNLTTQPAFSTIQNKLVGQAGSTSFTDPSATNDGPYFYRVGVQ